MKNKYLVLSLLFFVGLQLYGNESFVSPKGSDQNALQLRGQTDKAVRVEYSIRTPIPRRILPVVAIGAKYYVSTHGSDQNPGTKEKPFRHIQKCADIMMPGLADNFEGEAPDIGAYEHGGINWRPGYLPKAALFYLNKDILY